MRTLYLLAIIYIALILPLAGCTTTTQPVTSNNTTVYKQHANKDPVNINFLNAEAPTRPYKILGKTIVSKYNLVGIKRQEATIRDLMRQQAASLGGDALINVKHNDQWIRATVIAYKKILV